MARRIGSKPAGKNGAANDDTEIGDEDDGATARMPDPDVLKKTVAALNAENAELAKRRGIIGGIVKSAENDHQIDRNVLRLGAKLAAMEASKRDKFLRDVRYLALTFGWGDQGNLFDDAPAPTKTDNAFDAPGPDRTGEAAFGAV